MNLLPLNLLGARETAPGVVEFGIFLPWVATDQGNRLWVKVIHEQDQFLQAIPPLEFELSHSVDPVYGDYWSTTVDIAHTPKPSGDSAWGQQGRYVYRYCLDNPNVGRIDWIIDPFAREFGVGKLSAISLGYQPHVWSANETNWRTPAVDDLIVYELMLSEFGGSLEGARDRLSYLADLGVNCIEVMPLSNVSATVDWGFLPIGYFGVDERFGQRRDFQAFVKDAHRLGIAVIVDSVYGHTADDFPYAYLYDRLNYHENPFMGPFAKDLFGKSTDFARTFTQDFFYTVNHHWLDCYHVDGFRYDCVPNYWDGGVGQGYANLVYHTYQHVQDQVAAGLWPRFAAADGPRLIQMAEQLECPEEVLATTYSNLTWQNGTLGQAQAVAHTAPGALEQLGQRLGMMGYVGEVDYAGQPMAKRAVQYIENHDHSSFVCNFGIVGHDHNELLNEGDRGLWFKVQPYLIALLTARGVPLLWQGQEFGDNYYLPEDGLGRVVLLRPVRWDYFYDDIGHSVIGLVRSLIALRRRLAQFRSGNHYFHNDYDAYLSRGALLYTRNLGDAWSMVALNFTGSDLVVPYVFPKSGNYREELHGEDNLNNLQAGQQTWLRLPSNYGWVWSWEGA
jgi:1,4-alpha-glucan branching enzyme